MDHCSSEGATVGIQSYLSSRLKLQLKTTSKPKTISVQFQIKIHFDFTSISIFKITFQSSLQFISKSNKMSENIELSYVCIMKILNHDIQSKMGNMTKEWVVFNKLEDFNSLLKYTDDDFTPTGKLCYINENAEKLHRKLMKEFYNLRWYIQLLVDENEYQYGDNEWTNPLSESNWTYRTNKHFMKYVNFTLQQMTPEQLKQNPITVHPNQKLDTEEGESNIYEQESSISNKEEEEYSTFSDMSKQNSESDINIDDTQDQENSQTPETLQIHNMYNTTMHDKDDSIHDEYDTSEDENITEIETYQHYGEKIHETEESKPTETSEVLTVFNKVVHHEDDSSDNKSVIEIEPPKDNGEHENRKQDKRLTTKFRMEIDNRKVEGLITYSTEQQIFKFKVNSGTNQELWGVNTDFSSYELKWTIDPILQHMVFILQQRIHVS